MAPTKSVIFAPFAKFVKIVNFAKNWKITKIGKKWENLLKQHKAVKEKVHCKQWFLSSSMAFSITKSFASLVGHV